MKNLKELEGERMSFFKSIDISTSGLLAQRLRMNTIASNIANINTTSTPEGGYYKRKDVYFKTILMDKRNKIGGVIVDKIVVDNRPPIIKYDPSHPDADKEGYVRFPNIDYVEEMTNLIEANRAYQANLTVANNAKQLIVATIDMLKG